jgi:hypothetical protein
LSNTAAGFGDLFVDRSADQLIELELAFYVGKFRNHQSHHFVNRTLLPYHDRKEIDFEVTIDGKARANGEIRDVQSQVP